MLHHQSFGQHCKRRQAHHKSNQSCFTITQYQRCIGKISLSFRNLPSTTYYSTPLSRATTTPALLAWTTISNGITKEDASMLLETFKTFKIAKSKLVRCKVCALSSPHNMRRRMLVCNSKHCKDVEPLARCRWRCKTLTCQVMNLVSIFEIKSHISPLESPRKPRLTEEMKDVARSLAAEGSKPARIRKAFLNRFNLNESSLPPLRNVQRFTQHYTRVKLGGSDDFLDVRDQVVEMAFSPGQLSSDPFTFTWECEADGSPHVGFGSDQDPFIVCITTERLLRSADRDSGSFVMHADATFKLNQIGYSVFVVGISDMARSFHLLAVFVTSQRREPDYFKMFCALKNVCYRATGKEFSVQYAMADADDAQWRAAQAAFGTNCSFRSLMCYYHVTAKVYEKTRGLHPTLAAEVFKGVTDLHFAHSSAEYEGLKTRVLADWATRPELLTFSAYFKDEWLSGRFARWQAFHTPRGYATTNNPVEQFNRTIKRTYTLHARLKMGALLTQLRSCCRSESLSLKPLVDVPTASASLWRRMRELRRASSLFEWTPPRSSLAFVLDRVDDDAADRFVQVVSRPCRRVLDEYTGRKREVLLVTARISASSARMEWVGMPDEGWRVDIQRRECPCRTFAKIST